MRSRALWAGIAILVIAVVVLVLLLGRSSTPPPVASTPRDAGVATPIAHAPTAAPPAPVLIDAPGAYERPPATIESEGDPEPIGKGRATVIGRLLGEDGKPITAFGIMISRGGVGYLRIPGHIDTPDGRFVVDTVQAGTWSVFFAVPGLARKWVTGVKLVDGETTDLGDVVIDGGLKITGRVLDGSSQPIAGAKVSTSGGGMVISQIGATKMTDEYRAMRGVHETVTDASGTFVLTGLQPGLELSASNGSKWSQRVTVPDDDATIDLVIGPTGTISGTIVDAGHGIVSADLREGVGGNTGRVTDGQFEIKELAPGTYDVYFRGIHEVRAPRVVTIGINTKATVRFDTPRYVALDVTGCELVTLGPPGDKRRSLDMGRCGIPDKPTFAKVEPGRYSLCQRTACVDIEVAAKPARQSFVAPRKP